MEILEPVVIVVKNVDKCPFSLRPWEDCLHPRKRNGDCSANDKNFKGCPLKRRRVVIRLPQEKERGYKKPPK